MTACPGTAPTGLHDAEHIGIYIEAPWPGKPGPVRVLVRHRCMTWGCTERLNDWSEPAHDFDAVVRKVFEPLGMLGCSHTKASPTIPLYRPVENPRFYGECEQYAEATVEKKPDSFIDLGEQDGRPYG